MSTISIVKKGSQICIAADTLTSFGDMQISADMDAHPNKIQRLGETYIGIVGSAAHSLVIESAFQRGEIQCKFDSRGNIFNTFIKLHAILKEHYFLNPKDDDEDPYESTRIDCVLANHHGIFAVHGLREVYEYQRFWSIGSGADYALGAMFALYDSDNDARYIAEKSIEAGALFNSATALPMTSQVIEQN